MKSVWDGPSYKARVIRRLATVATIFATCTVFVIVAYHRNWEHAKARLPYECSNPLFYNGDVCHINSFEVWLSTVMWLIGGVLLLLAALVVLAMAAMYVFGDDKCKGCSCRNHKREVPQDAAVMVVGMLALVGTVALLFLPHW